MTDRTWRYEVVGRELTRSFSNFFGGWKPPRWRNTGHARGIETETQTDTFKRTLVSSAHGELIRLLLFMPSYAIQMKELRKGFLDLLTQLPSEFVIVYNVDGEEEIQKLITEANVKERTKLVPVPTHVLMTIWAQDAYMVGKDEALPNELCLLEPVSFRRFADSYIADVLERSKIQSGGSTATSVKTPIYFEGGNVLVADNFYLIGSDHLRSDTPSGVRAEDPAKMLEIYLESKRKMYWVGYKTAEQAPSVIKYDPETKRRKGKKWLVMDGTNPGDYQPVFHIDMFITLAGRKDGKYRVLVGDPGKAAWILRQKRLHKYARTEMFDVVAKSLKAIPNCKIIRNPLPLIWTEIDRYKAKRYLWDLPAGVEGVILYYFASYNNCVVEIPEHCAEICEHKPPRVWMPTYGHDHWPELKKTDRAMQRLWERLGFQVHLLGNYHPFAFQGGALHCLSKDLERGTRGPNLFVSGDQPPIAGSVQIPFIEPRV